VIIVAPTLTGLVVAFVAEGKEGLLTVLRRMIRWRAGLGWNATILLAPVLTSLAAVGVHILLGGAAPHFPLLKSNQHLILLTFLFYLLPRQSSAFLKEVGLRGYAQQQVRRQWGPLIGTLVLGVFFWRLAAARVSATRLGPVRDGRPGLLSLVHSDRDRLVGPDGGDRPG
jgi:membrane protease YdiL (CAAX protease family)